MGLKVKKLKLDITTPGKTLSPVPTIIPKAGKNYLSPPVKGGGGAGGLGKPIWKCIAWRMYFFLEGTFGDFEQKSGDYNYWVLPLFVDVLINIYIQWHVFCLPELKVAPIALYFFSTKYKYKIITNAHMWYAVLQF